MRELFKGFHLREIPRQDKIIYNGIFRKEWSDQLKESIKPKSKSDEVPKM